MKLFLPILIEKCGLFKSCFELISTTQTLVFRPVGKVTGNLVEVNRYN